MGPYPNHYLKDPQSISGSRTGITRNSCLVQEKMEWM